MIDYMLYFIGTIIFGVLFYIVMYIKDLKKTLYEIDGLVEKTQGKNTKAMIDVGFAYSVSKLNIPEKYNKAIKWYGKAAELGNKHAMYDLYNVLFYKIKSDNFKKGEAVHWLKESAKKDCYVAQIELAHLYSKGIFLPKDAQKSNYWTKRSKNNEN